MKNINKIEVWKPVVGYEDLYWVSSFGRVLSLGNDKTRNEKILKPMKNQKGYLRVALWKNGTGKWFGVHRLVIQTFNPVDNMDELTVDHISMEKTDNRLTNLRYATRKEQMCFNDQDFKTHAKKVFQYSKSGEFIREWESVIEIEKELGYFCTNISACCLGKPHFKSAYGYIWSYEKRES